MIRSIITLVSWAALAALALVGTLPVGTALILAMLMAATLTPVNRLRLAACPSAFDALRVPTENLPNTIYRKASQTNFWLGYITSEEFPQNTGVNQTVFVIGNTEPYSNTEAWTDVTLSNNVISTMCDSTYQDVDVGFNETTFAPRRFGLAGPVICHDTLSFVNNPTGFLRQYQMELVKRARRTWEFELRNRATVLYRKAIAGTQFEVVDNTTFPNFAANGELTLDMLDEAAQYLIEAGATDADQEWVELGPDGPIFPLVIGLQASQNLTTNQTDRRDDLRYADMGKGPAAQLMKRLGATRVIRNWRIVPVVLPPRYNFSGGYSQVNTYESVSASEGTVSRISSDYHNALYEVAFIPHPMAFTRAVVRPQSAGLNWTPINYMGEWVWKTTADGPISETYCYDPLGKRGRHFAEFMYAAKPIYPEFGVAIMYQRCLHDAEYAPCTPYYG